MDTIFTNKPSETLKTWIVRAESTITRDHFQIEMHATNKRALRAMFAEAYPTYRTTQIYQLN